MAILASLLKFRHDVCHEIFSVISRHNSLFLLLFLCHNSFLFLFAERVPDLYNLIIVKVTNMKAALSFVV